MQDDQTKRGGAREGAGRKPLDPEGVTVPVTIRMTGRQRDKLARLGGPKWVRERIDRAKEPEPPQD